MGMLTLCAGVQILWTFSIELESVCVLPQLLLLRQTSVPTVLDSFYLVTLGSYRFFYLLNWIVRGFSESYFDPISVLFGIIQTALYVDFAWVYWTRQRVKLRGGGVVDSDDLSKSFLVRRFIGQRANNDNDDDVVDEDAAALAGQENGSINNNNNSSRPAAPRNGRSWGARGISVSADDTLPDRPGAGQHRADEGYTDISDAQDARMIDPAHFEDDADDDDADAPLPPAKNDGYQPRNEPTSSVVDEPTTPDADEIVGSSAEEWQENTGAK